LPVGISFYTFHGLSYVIDIYYGRIKYEKNLVNYALFVSFFPLLVAGPIERATHLLPQINRSKLKFNYHDASLGLKYILWGYFKKIVIADNCGYYANHIFDNYTTYNGSTLLLGSIFFAFQIYCDFSAYSEIAYGTAKLFGYEILKNFNFPYLSKTILEFWKSWHISLTSWFRDYVYIPLGGNRVSKLKQNINLFFVFVLSGIWHGANWTFIFWGMYNALLVIAYKNNFFIPFAFKFKIYKSLSIVLNTFITFILVIVGWIFFRSENINMAFRVLNKIFSKSVFTLQYFQNRSESKVTIVFVLLLLIIEFLSRYKKSISPIELISKQNNRATSFAFYYALVISILYYGNFIESSFIYFQF
jgi:alginate O-acetyltransferase complex protein AlgI